MAKAVTEDGQPRDQLSLPFATCDIVPQQMNGV
jgi:hypothetical protein